MKKKLNPLLQILYLTLLSTIGILVGSNEKTRAEGINTSNTQIPLDEQRRLPPILPDIKQETLPSPEVLPPPENFLEKTPTTTPTKTIDRNNELSITVKEWKIEGNTAFTNGELEELLAEYLNKPLYFADLLEIETVVTKYYTDRGYLNSGVIIPIQDIENGIVTIRAIEGQLDRIFITINGRLDEEYIRSRLTKGIKNPLNINQLQSTLQSLQLDPIVENINAELAVGSSRELWVLDIKVNQADAFKPLIFVNNSRTPSVGSVQRGIEINHNNFAGLADKLSLVYKNTDGSNDYNVNYTIPFNSSNGTIGFDYRYVDSEIVEKPFDDLDIGSLTDKYTLSLRQPLWAKASSRQTQEFALGVELSRQANTVKLDEEPFGLSEGANDGETIITALRFFQDWTRRTRVDVLATRSQFSVGLDLFDSTINSNPDLPDSSFFAWRGQFQWLRQLNARSNINLLLRSDIQLSTSNLVSLEQFSLGGISSVRGYRQDALLGDNGALFSAEVRIPVYRWNKGQGSMSLIPFADFGTVWNKEENNSNLSVQDKDTLISVGLGWQLAISDRLNARLDWGIPLVTLKDNDRTWQENGVYFSVEFLP